MRRKDVNAKPVTLACERAAIRYEKEMELRGLAMWAGVKYHRHREYGS